MDKCSNYFSEMCAFIINFFCLYLMQASRSDQWRIAALSATLKISLLPKQKSAEPEKAGSEEGTDIPPLFHSRVGRDEVS